MIWIYFGEGFYLLQTLCKSEERPHCAMKITLLFLLLSVTDKAQVTHQQSDVLPILFPLSLN